MNLYKLIYFVFVNLGSLEQLTAHSLDFWIERCHWIQCPASSVCAVVLFRVLRRRWMLDTGFSDISWSRNLSCESPSVIVKKQKWNFRILATGIIFIVIRNRPQVLSLISIIPYCTNAAHLYFQSAEFSTMTRVLGLVWTRLQLGELGQTKSDWDNRGFKLNVDNKQWQSYRVTAVAYYV